MLKEEITVTIVCGIWLGIIASSIITLFAIKIWAFRIIANTIIFSTRVGIRLLSAFITVGWTRVAFTLSGDALRGSKS